MQMELISSPVVEDRRSEEILDRLSIIEMRLDGLDRLVHELRQLEGLTP